MNYKKYLHSGLSDNTDTAKVLAALLAGVALGAAIGILFAPESGSETRSLISDKAKDLASNVKDKVQTAKDSLSVKADELKDAKDEVVSKAKEKYNRGSGEIDDAING
ncbi:YtxH domain-containing protein [Arcticibacter eurypsychrophilus]|uniref:YtxH domain-containing protein n=1 Tax=Arcticibacter eurypsychrophilus TaxID=1434752 RepID=UPI00084D96B1|nr:YtxH domain-containing protein [Arcticibacter eurypsychrophilus]